MQKLVIIIRKLAAYGEPSPVGADSLRLRSGQVSPPLQARHSWHAISNQIWLWNILLTLAIIPLIAILFPVFDGLLGAARWNYLAAYGSIPVGIALVQIGLFWWGNKNPLPATPYSPLAGGEVSAKASPPFRGEVPEGRGGSIPRRTLALHLLIASDCLMLWLFSLLIGAGGGIHFLFPAALALPFYFFRREIQPRAWVIKCVWVVVILLQFLLAVWMFQQSSPASQGGVARGLAEQSRWTGWFFLGLKPLPVAITQITRIVVVTLSLLIAAIWGIYFWWQLEVTKKAMAFWERLSLLGIPAEISGGKRKEMIIYNRSALIAILFTEILFPGGILFMMAIAYFKGERNIFSEHYLIFLPVILGAWLPVGFFYTKLRHPEIYFENSNLRQVSSTLGIASLGLYVFLVNTCLPYDILNHLYFIAHLAGAIILRGKGKESAGKNFLLLAIPLLFYALTIAWHRHYEPMMPIWPWAILPIQIGNLISFIACIAIVIFYLSYESDKSELALEVAHAESEKLLLNILPAQVSAELKSHGRTTPCEYPSATVLFTDFVGFTRIAERLTAVDLVRELDQCFSYFDSVAEKYGLEKLKTIGDAYMAVAGIPVENNTHPIDCALAALEIQSFMNQMKEIKEQQGFPYWELRLGMHTGSLVAGVVGEKKFAYDVWGDTVNTASRMESSGEPGAINISREMYDRLRFMFECEFRGKVYAKNKGEIEMYFLRGLKPKYSVSGLGRVPNRDFKDLYERIRNGAKLVAK